MEEREKLEFDPPVRECILCGGEILQWGQKARAGHLFLYSRCRECGFVFVNPRPAFASLSEHYARNAGGTAPQEWTAAPVVDPASWEARAVARLIAMRGAAGRFLDVGAGNGAFSCAAAAAGMQVTAMELDPVDVRNLAQVPNVKVAESSFECFDAQEGSFDFVMMSHVLEHAHDPKAWLEKAARLLTSGGLLAVYLPNFDSIYRYAMKTGDPFFIPPEHLNHFSRRSLERACERLGMEEIHSSSTTSFKDDVVTKRVRMPGVVASVVRAATRVASSVLDISTRVTGTGSVLLFHARRK